MITHISFLYDFSVQGSRAAPFVHALADQFHARVTVLSVVPPTFEVMPAGLGVRAGEDVADWLRTLKSRLDDALITESAGLPVERITDAGDPGFRITDVAQQPGRRPDRRCPRMGSGSSGICSSGRPPRRCCTMRGARCGRWRTPSSSGQEVCPGPSCAPWTAAPASVALLRWAADFSARVGAALTLLHVVGPKPGSPSLASERALQEQVRQAAHATIVSLQASAGVRASLRVAVGDIVATVTEQAREEDADSILIGRGALKSALGRLRTHAYGIIQRSPCPVLSV